MLSIHNNYNVTGPPAELAQFYKMYGAYTDCLRAIDRDQVLKKLMFGANDENYLRKSLACFNEKKMVVEGLLTLEYPSGDEPNKIFVGEDNLAELIQDFFTISSRWPTFKDSPCNGIPVKITVQSMESDRLSGG